ALAILLFYAEENWRGRRALRQYEERLAARGDSLYPAVVAAPPVPDAQNFALTPIVRSLYEPDGVSSADEAGMVFQTNVLGYRIFKPYSSKSGYFVQENTFRVPSLMWPSSGDWRASALTDLDRW